MDLFDVLALIGGLCLFLFGMKVMGDGLERRAGSGLKSLLAKLSNNKIVGFLTGLGVTAVIQSSSATTVMVVGFVNSGLMTLKQSVGVIMGANVGTTVTAWVLSLGSITGGSFILELLKPSSFTPVLALIGTIFTMFSKSGKKKDTGSILLGFATLMCGMDAMSAAVSGLREIPEFRNLLIMFQNPVLGVLVGAALTAIIQSSSAAVGILQALSVTGAVTNGAAIPILMGMGIGTCITAVLSSLGTGKNARRAAFIHLAFNVIGTFAWLTVFSVLTIFVRPAFMDESATYLSIAVINTVFKSLCTVLLLPMSGMLERLSYVFIRDGEEDEKPVELDERLLVTPSIALEQCYQLAVKMGTEAVEGFKMALAQLDSYDPDVAAKVRKLEKKTDHYEDVIGSYLTKLARSQVSDTDGVEIPSLLKAIGDFERISDHSVNLLESAEELREKKMAFSEKAKQELGIMCAALTEVLDNTLDCFATSDVEKAYNVEPLEQVVDDLKRMLRNTHIARLTNGECTVEAGFIWADLLTNLERTSDHCSNVALTVIDTHHQDMNAHIAIRQLKHGDTGFAEKYQAYAEKYHLS